MKRISLMLLHMALLCQYTSTAQSVDTAVNGLTKTLDTVSLGGTLDRHTDIDMGGSFNLRFKKGSNNYLSILNNGNIGLGVASPLAQFHTSGSLRLDMFKNNTAGDSILTTDANGNIRFINRWTGVTGLNSGEIKFKGTGYMYGTLGWNAGTVSLQSSDSSFLSSKQILILAPDERNFYLRTQHENNAAGVESQNYDTRFDLKLYSHRFSTGKSITISPYNINFGGFSNNAAGDSILTTDINGNLKLIPKWNNSLGGIIEGAGEVKFASSNDPWYGKLGWYPGSVYLTVTDSTYSNSQQGLILNKEERFVTLTNSHGNSAAGIEENLTDDTDPYLSLYASRAAASKSIRISPYNIRLTGFNNNTAQDSILTTDANGNLIFRSIASYFRPGDDPFTINTVGLTDSARLDMGKDEQDLRHFSVTYKGKDYLDQDVTNQLKLSNVFSLLHEGGGNLANIYSSPMGLEVAAYTQNGFGTKGSLGVAGESIGLNIEGPNPSNYASISLSTNQNPNLREQVQLYAVTGSKGNMLTIDSTGILFSRHNSTEGTVPNFKMKYDGSMIFNRYLNNASEDSVLTTDATGKLKFKSLSSSLLYAGNGLTGIGDSLHMGGSLLKHTIFDGNNNNLEFGSFTSPLNNFSYWANNSSTLVSLDTLTMYGGHFDITGQNDLNLSTNGGNINLNAQSSGSGISLSNGGLYLYSADSINVSANKINLGYFFRDTSGNSLVTTDANGNLQLRSMTQALPSFTNGLTYENGTVKLGGEVSENTQLYVTGDQHFSIATDDDRAISILQEFEGREWMVQLRNQNAEVYLQRNALGFGVRDFSSGFGYWSNLSMNPFQNQLGLSINGGFQETYVKQNEYGEIHIGTEAKNFESSFTNKNILRLDTTGLYYSIMDNEKFSINNNGTLRLGNYLNNANQDQVLTTDTQGNLVFKSIQADLVAINGLSIDSARVKLGGLLTDEETIIDGQTTKALRLYNLNEFTVTGNTLNMEGSYLNLASNTGSFMVVSDGIHIQPANDLFLRSGGMDKKISLASQVDWGYGFTPVWHELKIDTAGINIINSSVTGGDIEHFRFGLDGRAYFRQYGSYYGNLVINDGPTFKALYIDSLTGKILYGDISLTSALHAANGLTYDGDSLRLGGALTNPSTVINGNSNDLQFNNLHSFNVNSQIAQILGTQININGSGGSLNFDPSGMNVYGSKMKFEATTYDGSPTKDITLRSHFFNSVDYSTSEFDFHIDYGGVGISFQDFYQQGPVELFRFTPEGRAYFNRYAANYGTSPFEDGPTSKALYIDENSGQVMYGNIIGGGGPDSTKWGTDSFNIYTRNSGNVGVGTLIPTAKFHTLGSIRFESFKNNLQGDSVLTTDTEGNLKFTYMPFGSGGGSGSSYNFHNGIQQANGNVALGGLLEDSVTIDLAGYPFSFNNAAERLLHISGNGTVGIGTVASNDFRLSVMGDMTIGNSFDSVGDGERLFFNGYGNSDAMWMRRHNAGTDASELRVSVGDDGSPNDKFHIGYIPWNNPGTWQTSFLVQSNGQVGVGTSAITSDLSVGQGHGNKLSVGNSQWLKTNIITTGWDENNGDYADLLVPGAETNSAFIRLNKAGNVGIGTLAPDAQYRLSVNGKIRAKGLRVQSAGWADYVFDPGYKLMKLPELEKYIKSNRHLPGIATADEVNKNGVDVGETQVQLLKKIEELTLYVIDLNKQVKELEEKNKKLENQQTQISAMQQQLEELKKLVSGK